MFATGQAGYKPARAVESHALQMRASDSVELLKLVSVSKKAELLSKVHITNCNY